MAPSAVTKKAARTPAAKKSSSSSSAGDDSAAVEAESDSGAVRRSSRRKSNLPQAPVSASKSSASPKKKKHQVEYEFGGPLGALGVIVGLPLVIFLLYFLCNEDVCMTNPFTFAWGSWFSKHLPHSLGALYSTEAMYMYVGWMVFHVVLERVLPGESVLGAPLDNGTRLPYTMSGHLQFWVTLIAMGHAIPAITESTPGSGVYEFRGFHPLNLGLIYDHYVQLIFLSVVGAALLSVYLYWSSFWGGKVLAKGGNTGNAIYDFFIGRELNPRVGSLDLKEFCELRPGLIGWLVINLGMAFKQYAKRRAQFGRGSVSMSMLLVTLFQGFYVWDALYMEKAILTTMDITTDGFGYMLAFGDLAWVPFIYSLQARYLVDYDPALPLWHVGLVVLVHFLGYYIFRSANSEKDSFRRDPEASEVRHLRYLQTKRGTRLLTSGWWGMARKINYTGDWLITFSWCLLCGFSSPVAYFQAIYFLVLLVHRAIRDDHMCAEKYGDDWTEYKRRVPYVFIPYVV